MNITINNIKYNPINIYSRRINNENQSLSKKTSNSSLNDICYQPFINFKGKNKEIPAKYQENLNNLKNYFRENADVYLKYFVDNPDSGNDVIDLATFSWDRTKGFLDAAKNFARSKIVQNGKIAYEDEYVINLSCIKNALEVEELTPEGFSDLLKIASNNKRDPIFDVYGAIESMHTYNEIKKNNNNNFSPEDYLIFQKEYFNDDTVLLSKEEVDLLDENSDLFKFAYIKDLKNAKSKEDVFKNLAHNDLDDATVVINTPFIFLSALRAKQNKTLEDMFANDAYAFLEESQGEVLDAHENCKQFYEFIKNDFDVEIEKIPEDEYIPQIYENVFENIYDELCAWRDAGKDEFIPPAFIDLSNFDLDNIKMELRSELTAGNIKIFGKRIHMTNNFGLSDEDAIQKILNEKLYIDEFKKAGVPQRLISQAYRDPVEFVSIAARGKFSEYSDEFKQVLVDFGMPEWELDLKD